MAVEAEVTAAAVILAVEAILAVVHTSVVVGISAARALAAPISAAPASAGPILAGRGSGRAGERALPRGPGFQARAQFRVAAAQNPPPTPPPRRATPPPQCTPIDAAPP